MFVFSSKCFIKTSIQKMFLVFTVLVDVSITNPISQNCRMPSSHFSFLPCQMAVSRHHTMGYNAPKVRKQENVLSDNIKHNFKKFSNQKLYQLMVSRIEQHKRNRKYKKIEISILYLSIQKLLSLTHFLCILFYFILFIYFQRKGGRKRGRETSMCGCLSHVPNWGPGP